MGQAASSGSDAVTDGSVLVGLVGSGIAASRTPAMHEAEGRALGLSYVYRLLDTERMEPKALRVADMLDWAERFGFSGLNITFPFKQLAMPLLTDFAPEAAAVGSVNTVLFRDGRRIGHNTDYWGFRQSFLDMLPRPQGSRVLLVGAGGAGVAVAQAMVDAGVGALAILDTDQARAAALASRLTSSNCAVSAVRELNAATMALVDGVVNATPVGMAKMPGTPIDTALLQARHWVSDIVYFPLETDLLRVARLKGCRVVSGEGMAVWQAVKAFELFSGVKPDPSRMRATFRTFDRQAPAA